MWSYGVAAAVARVGDYEDVSRSPPSVETPEIEILVFVVVTDTSLTGFLLFYVTIFLFFLLSLEQTYTHAHVLRVKT